MPERLKDRFLTRESLGRMAEAVSIAWPHLDRERFLAAVYDSLWPSKELMARMRHVTRALHAALPADYSSALFILRNAAPQIVGFEALCLSEFVAVYGLDHFDLSMDALRFFTRFASAEFAVRAFIQQDAPRAMAYMLRWATDESVDVRRLASEGCRPRLPWGVGLSDFKRDPSPILPILERLRDDPAETVRNSVANNLNDIAKDHPDLVLDLCERWYGHSRRTDWIVRHALRTLLKAGNPRALRLLGLDSGAQVTVARFAVTPEWVPIGQDIEYSFDLVVLQDAPVRVRMELRVDYARPGGRTSRKVFQIREAVLPPGTHRVRRKMSLAHRSTRAIFPGLHRLTIVANGQEQATVAVEVMPEE